MSLIHHPVSHSNLLKKLLEGDMVRGIGEHIPRGYFLSVVELDTFDSVAVNKDLRHGLWLREH